MKKSKILCLALVATMSLGLIAIIYNRKIVGVNNLQSFSKELDPMKFN
ncbi:hypothetical protein [Clostridium tagluense]|uniref:Uncharacterized protein n=1 Tax=Clostridium tagluense TaxID=360422 RepID=A0A401URM8_9CLOT|nr:hypothetical protein [Clostridium tagluense]GCD12184.1 hypothetical protein Ctaglu_38070 [Clostridium tagluense]